MARDLQTRTIDGELYEFYQLSPRIAVKILTRLLKVVGSPVGEALGRSTGSESLLDLELKGDVMGNIVKALTERLDEDMVLNTIEELLQPVMCKGIKVGPQFETHFAGRISHLMKVVWAALEVNYSDFFGEGFGLEGLRARVVASKSIPVT